MIAVFYDGKCGVCAREIRYYQKISPPGIFDWRDITESVDMLEKDGINLLEALKAMHAKDSNGKFHLGVDAFILIWDQLPRWRMLGKVISLPLIRQIAELAYKAFAKWRFRRLIHCQMALQQKI